MKFVKSRTVNEALSAVSLDPENSKFVAGGTDLMIKLNEGHTNPTCIIDVSDIDEMKKIEVDDSTLRIGASSTFNQMVNSKYIKTLTEGLWEAASLVGAPQIRNMGTIGGNVANASPAADTSPVLLALGANISLSRICDGKIVTRTIPIDKFFIGKGMTDIGKDELITEFIIDLGPDKKRIVGFEKLGLRNALAISKISVAISVFTDGNIITQARIASGSIGQIPTFESEISEFPVGRSVDERVKETTIRECSSLFSNIIAKRLEGRSTAAYKTSAVEGVFARAFRKALSQRNTVNT